MLFIVMDGYIINKFYLFNLSKKYVWQNYLTDLFMDCWFYENMNIYNFNNVLELSLENKYPKIGRNRVKYVRRNDLIYTHTNYELYSLN